MAIAQRLPVVVGLAGLVGMMLTAPVLAVDSTDTLQVTAKVNGNCSVSGSTLDFGDYDKSKDQDAQTSITYDCGASAAVQIGLDTGSTNPGGERQMKNATDSTIRLGYDLFKNNTRTERWGNNSDGSFSVLKLPASTGGSVPVFGRILAGQTVAPGDYADTITITLTVL
jgi:spore coat protein U-like protein